MDGRTQVARMQRITGVAGVLALLLSAAACQRHGPPPAPAAQPHAVRDVAPVQYASERGAYQVQVRVAGLQHPWSLAFLPGGDALVTERPGRLRRIGTDGRVSAPIGGVPAVHAQGQAGLLDVLPSPGFARDRTVFLAFCEPNLRGNLCGTAVARARLEGDALREVRVIYRQAPKASAGTHVGGRLVFDAQGHLYVTQGDNRTTPEAAQQLDRLQGKLVRIDADGGIPRDNPFVGRDDARPEIWSLGHRNIQGAAVHPDSGRVWTSEHGPMGGDELNIPQAGGNYGWPLATSGLDYSGAPVPGSVGASAPGTQPPHHVWARSPALSGMLFYTGAAFPQWRGNLFLGALASGELIRLDLDGDRIVHEERLLRGRGQRIRDVRQGPDGALYVLTDEEDGKLLRIAPVPGVAGSVPASAPPGRSR